MPYLKLETNVAVPEAKAGALLKELSATVARVTGKPESVVQVVVSGGIPMLMAGSGEPAAHVEVKAIGFPEENARPMSEAVCGLLERELGIPGKRVFLAFVSYKGSMWGVDGRTY